MVVGDPFSRRRRVLFILVVVGTDPRKYLFVLSELAGCGSFLLTDRNPLTVARYLRITITRRHDERYTCRFGRCQVQFFVAVD